MANTSAAPIQGDSTLGRVVHVAVPREVLYDLASLNKVKASILGRLGCRGCHSGWDIRFDINRQFVVDEKLNIREGMMGGVIIHG
jgi:hypothetical protein